MPYYGNADPLGKQVSMILLRELPGFAVIGIYFVALPPLLAMTCLRTFYQRMGYLRFMGFTQLLLWMAALPLKMVLRWALNLKYLVNIPEYFFNI